MENHLFYIVDAGGSKTEVAIVSPNSVKIISFSAYNPNSSDDKVFKELNQSLNKEVPLFFYGSGLSSIKNQQIVKEKLNSIKVEAHSDLLGTARALLKNKKGIISILGTGGVAAYFDGESIKETKGGYGYLIDDFGGGFELGKNIVSKWLNQDFNQNTTSKIEKYFNTPKDDFIKHFYKDKQLSLISNLCVILPELALNDDILNQAIINYFNVFIEKHLIDLSKKHQQIEISFTGSIAYFFRGFLNEALSNKKMKVKSIIQKPIYELIDFHKSQK